MSEDLREKLFPLDEKTSLADSNEGEINLPGFKVKSQAVWSMKELWSWPAFQIAGSVFASLTLVETVLLHVKRVELPLVVIAIGFTVLALELLLIALTIALDLKRENVAKKHRGELCRLVMLHQPGFTLSSWDIIAVSMNAYLKREGLWHTATCFGSGFALYTSYRQKVYLPLKAGKFDDDADVALLLDAAASYEQSVRIPQISSEKTEASNAALQEQKLPVEVYRSKISWALAFLAKQFLFGCFGAVIYSFGYRGYTRLLLIVMQLPPVLIRWFTRGKCLTVTQVGQLLKTVEDLEPWEDNSNWDDVAKSLNQLMGFNKNTYFSAGFFYDGDDCRHIFESKLSSITSSSKHDMPEFVALATELQAACGLDVAGCV
ncbi:uncharacterized protein LALA0_S08e07426g [Lachancea lanzarotensis]|uniref:LALA0S08e07426g1_1 n=1 Tax=Lachancea lanzarotensis TaxID=1245769 RepID=A0A0C7NDD5_9SACH|nr:uncharacterized protein LALA0_S08e07426g [Lachancea lanzarotensis]CEP63648.1 LALA0S08e07426g1_1 [Lachancea lanzarotensis]